LNIVIYIVNHVEVSLLASFEICGGRSLQGDIKIQGSKNAVLPILAATVLNKGITKLYNCPEILDVYNMIKILESIGCIIEVDGNTVTVDATDTISGVVSLDYVASIRSSIILLGAILGRIHSVEIPYPGGCVIGERPIDMHLKALEQMNVSISEADGIIRCETKALLGGTINLPYPSVGATENIILAAILAKGSTEISNAAKEPEIVDLCLCLNEMGANIHGMGTAHIVVNGVKRLQDAGYTIMPDRIVAGTYLAAAAATYGNIQIYDVWEHDIKSILEVFAHMGCGIVIRGKRIRLIAPQILLPVESIRTRPFPGFPTDMQSQLLACLCIARGQSTIYEDIFEDRFKAVEELEKMGANILLNKNKAIINGVSKLRGATVKAKELRGGAALVIAGLMAEGDAKIENSIYVERGYQDICGDLSQLGACIRIVEDR